MGLAGLGIYVETKYSATLFASQTAGEMSPLIVAGPTILLSVGFFALVHGMKVGAARQKYKELARKDGEKDVDLRYGLPNLYVDGNSKHARAFNTIQRSHQHILETYPSVILGSFLAAYQFPLCSALFSLLYAVGRITLSLSYANSDGDPSKRYSNPMARLNWYGLLTLFLLGFASGIKTLATVKFASK